MLDRDERRKERGESRTEAALVRVSRRLGFFWCTPRTGRWISVAGRLDECQDAALGRHALQLNGSSLALGLSILTHGRVMPFSCFALYDLPVRELRRYALSAELYRFMMWLTCTHGRTYRLHGYTCILCVGAMAGVQNHAGADWGTSDTACRHSLKPSLLPS